MAEHVTAAMAVARTVNDTVVYLYFGDVVPSNLTEDSLKHLRSLGFVSKGAESETVSVVLPVPVQSGPEEKPAGNASEDVWMEFALRHADEVGKTADELVGMSRNELRDLFK